VPIGGQRLLMHRNIGSALVREENMFSKPLPIGTLLLVLGLNVSGLMGQSDAGPSNMPLTSPPVLHVTAVPSLASFSGRLTDVGGKPITIVTGVTFALYEDSDGGAPLWMEVQNVQPDKTGRYTLALGSATSGGLPSDLFVSGEARWLGVQVQGQAEQPRVLLLSVPYAMKAADAETLGGYPLSAFVLAQPGLAIGQTSPVSTTSANSIAPAATAPDSRTASNVTTAGGTVNAIPLWTGASSIANSALFQSGTGATAKIGVNTTTAATTLDVSGATTIRGNLSLSATGIATATAGKVSQPVTFTASVFNTSSTTAVSQFFRWQAEPVGNNTTTASGSLNLLYAQGTGAMSETGLKVGSNGRITFATGQTFPGTGKGTITGVTAGTGMTGGGTSGIVTLNIDATKVPLLNASNTFSGNQSVTGNLSASSIQAGSAALTANNSVAQTIDQSSVYGDAMEVNSADVGILAYTTDVGIYGQSSSEYGVWGTTSGSGVAGVYGDAGASFGVLAQSVQSQALWAETQGTGSSNGAGPDGVHGVAHASAGSGVAGINDAAGGIGVYGRETASGSYAGRFDGNVWVNGNLSKNGGSFKIDHPLDPSNKYLYHSFVESPDMKNIYDGVVTLDPNGEAVVPMPDWFGALNRDFRYQLTCLGGFAPVYIAKEMANNQFKIGGGKPGMKISWQVTGIRQDAWANSHRIPVEEAKPKDEHGTYLHPELFGAPETSAVGWGRYRFPDNAAPRKPRIAPRPAKSAHVKAAQIEAPGTAIPRLADAHE
jgi:trimeric autotransporter adhesin